MPLMTLHVPSANRNVCSHTIQLLHDLFSAYPATPPPLSTDQSRSSENGCGNLLEILCRKIRQRVEKSEPSGEQQAAEQNGLVTLVLGTLGSGGYDSVVTVSYGDNTVTLCRGQR